MIDFSLFTYPYDHELCESLAQRQHEVTLLTRPLREGESWKDEIHYRIQTPFYARSEALHRQDKRSLWQLGLKGLEHILGLWKLRKSVLKQRPDVLHLQWTVFPFFDGLFIWSLKKRLPVLLTVHDTDAFLGAASSPLQYWGWVFCLKQAVQLLVHTEGGRQKLLEKGINLHLVQVIPHGPLKLSVPVRTSLVPAQDLSLQHISHREEKIILMFGALKPYKGLDVLVEALSALPLEVRKDWKVLIAGKPFFDLDPIKECIRDKGLHEMFLWQSKFITELEMDELFRRAAIMVFPYKSIDVSGVLMAVIPYGKTVVASRIGIFQTLLTDQKNALLFEKENSLDFKNQLEKLMVDPQLRKNLGESLRSLDVKVLGWNELAIEYEKLYSQVRDSQGLV